MDKFKQFYNLDETELKEKLGEIIKKIILSTGRGEIMDYIGYDSRTFIGIIPKYSKEYIFKFKGKELYYSKYYDIFTIDSDEMEDNVQKKEMIELLTELNGKFIKFSRGISIKKRELFKLYFE